MMGGDTISFPITLSVKCYYNFIILLLVKLLHYRALLIYRPIRDIHQYCCTCRLMVMQTVLLLKVTSDKNTSSEGYCFSALGYKVLLVNYNISGVEYI